MLIAGGATLKFWKTKRASSSSIHVLSEEKILKGKEIERNESQFIIPAPILMALSLSHSLSPPVIYAFIYTKAIKHLDFGESISTHVDHTSYS